MDEKGSCSGSAPFENSPTTRLNGIKSVFTFSDVNQQMFSDAAQFEDFGRESWGIIDINHPDSGRESLGFLCNPTFEDFGRESLGIINLNDLDTVRESMGFTHLSAPNCNNSALNNAFFVSSSSIGGSVSPLNSVNPSFNSSYLNGTIFSRISTSSVFTDKNDILDTAFIGSADYFKHVQLFKNASAYCSSVDNKIENFGLPHLRTFSLPSKFEIDEKEGTRPDCDKQSFEGKVEEQLKGDCSLMGNCSFVDNDAELNDLVFIEANHLAYRLGNESALAIEDCDDDLIDSIQEPEGFADVSTDSIPTKTDQKAIFKTVDKLFPTHNFTLSNKEDSQKQDSNCSNTKSKDPKEMLNTLSEILNNSNPTEHQKSEGQNLLSKLADILISSGSCKSSNLDDSGHSSVENEPLEPIISQSHECYEILDLTKKSTPEGSIAQADSYENCAPLDLSMKSKSSTPDKVFASPKILPPKFNNSQQKSLIKNKSIGSNCSLSSNENKSFDLKNKFRPKKNEEKKINKGPLKAMIPIDNMARKKNVIKPQVTPTQTSKLKKTSTPINELNIKPMAQSTPDNAPYLESPLRSHNSSIDTSSKLVKQKLNYSRPNDANTERTSLTRRRSEEDLKKTQTAGRTIGRSYSMGESALKSTISRLKPKIQASTSITKNSMSNTSVLKTNNANRSGTHLTTYKKIGKENMLGS